MRRFDWSTLRQLALGLDGIDEVGGPQDGDAHIRSERARVAFEALRGTPSGPGWMEDYFRLRDHGWPWRIAAYIAWASSPKRARKPRTLQELATSVLGLTSPRQVYVWLEKNPGIKEAIAMLQAASLWEHRRDVFDALVKVASEPDYKGHADRRLFFEMVGDYVPRSRLDARVRDGAVAEDDLSHMSDDELRALAQAALKMLEVQENRHEPGE